MPVTGRRALLARAREEQGIALVVALGVLLVTGLLFVAAYTAANGDVGITQQYSTERQAYYAALAGVQEYEYQMQAEPNYWQQCATPSGTVAKEPAESYKVKPLPAGSSPYKECSTEHPFQSMIEATGPAANTFHIESTGYAGKSQRSLVASFQVDGFLNYVYFTRYETEDPGLYENGAAPAGCKEKYYSTRPSRCVQIKFITGDKVNGPIHTDDSPAICGSPSFGRLNHTPPDAVQFYRPPYESSGCYEGMHPTYNTVNGEYTKGIELIPPQSDVSLAQYVESANEFSGVTHIVLDGSTNTVEVTEANGEQKVLPWPANGLIYVRSAPNGSCNYVYESNHSDESREAEGQTACGNVYVSGTYSRSLTIGSEGDVIIDGDIYPTSVAGKLGAAPTGTAALGLIANNYVRVYHPLEQNCRRVWNWRRRRWEEQCYGGFKNGAGSMYNPWIYAAILSTTHSFVVDNYEHGEPLGELNVYGAIAQNYRGIVGTSGGYGGDTGYIKNYVYDDRLAVDEPPFFLSPLNAGWKVARVTAPAKP